MKVEIERFDVELLSYERDENGKYILETREWKLVDQSDTLEGALTMMLKRENAGDPASHLRISIRCPQVTLHKPPVVYDIDDIDEQNHEQSGGERDDDAKQ